MSDWFDDEKKEALPDTWKSWAEQHASAETMDQQTKDTYFGVSAAAEDAEPVELASVVDVPAGEHTEGMA